MKPKKLRKLKMEKVRAILMCVLDFGEKKSVTGNSTSEDPLSSPSMFSTRITVICISSLTSFFVWDKTRTSSTFVLKIYQA
jgi:hypothetical protein